MLHELHIKNLALIDESRIKFGVGFNVITGETGAGKTVVVGAVNLLLGGRADSSHVRKGCDKAEVTGVFSKSSVLSDLPEALTDLIEDDDQIIVRRVISSDGKNKCYVNDTAVTVSSLAEIGRRCIDLHGQHEHQSLFKISNHVDYLDNFGGETLLQLRADFVAQSKQYKQLIEKLHKIKNAERELLGRKDLLEFQIREIETAELKIGEDEELKKERDILRNAEKIFEAVSMASSSLTESEIEFSTGTTGISASNIVANAVTNLETVNDYDARIKTISERLNTIQIELEDCSAELKEFVDGFQIAPGRLEEVESRLSQISLLKRKYGSTIGSMLEYLDNAKEELSANDVSEDAIKRLEEDIKAASGKLAEIAKHQSEERKRVATLFSDLVCKELSELNMPNARFEVLFKRDQDTDGPAIDGANYRIQSNGIDKIEFMVSANKGEILKQLVKVASGGEISRIMLAIKIVLADTDKTPTLIFDEVDTGIGGKTAADIGRKMATLARKHQVLSVTHLPQIASFADKHISVLKREEGDRTITQVIKLKNEDIIKEMARLLSGNAESEVSIRHAEELLADARQIKCGGQ